MANKTLEQEVTLDRAQRDALRQELGVDAHVCTDVVIYFDRGDRAGVARLLAKLSNLVYVMDAIGWQESVEAPELLQVTVDEKVAVWAERAADDLAVSFAESISVDPDGNLDALGALRLIARSSR